MKAQLYTINKSDLFDLFSRLSADNDVIVPYRKGERLYFGKFDTAKEDSIELGSIRQSEPFKSFIAHSKEKVLGISEKSHHRPMIVAGVKGCDLKSLKLQDFVFQKGDFTDPFYIAARQNTLIIANDCTEARETCFCMAMDGRPYPQNDFDISLAPANSLFLVEVGSPKGRALIDDYKAFFKDAAEDDISVRDSKRRVVCGQVKGFIDKRGTPDTTRIKGAVKKNYNLTTFWQDYSSTCVECGACNLICPTCHCFLLFDTEIKNGYERMKIWDSCLYNRFARVAGGANPRRHLYERLRNRFDKKFGYFPGRMDGYYACTGCGRCIEACPGDIDIREVLKGLVNGVWNKPPND